MKRLKTIKQYIWAPLQPLYPFFRFITIRSGIIKQEPIRQHFHLGYLKKEVDHSTFRAHLHTYDFAYQWFAFVDPDEKYGMRKLCEKNCRYQYHVRVFNDGEVRGHYEKTPEDHPFDHLHEIDFQDKREDFMNFFGEFIEQKEIKN